MALKDRLKLDDPALTERLIEFARAMSRLFLLNRYTTWAMENILITSRPEQSLSAPPKEIWNIPRDLYSYVLCE